MMGDDSLPPKDVVIEPFDNGSRAFGRPVIDFETIRIQAGRVPFKMRDRVCNHSSLVYNDEERRVWCEDCKSTVDPYDVFMIVVRDWHKITASINGKLARATEAVEATLVRRAAKSLDRAWGKGMAPACPHCNGALLPEDYADGARLTLNREMEEARRKRTKEQP